MYARIVCCLTLAAALGFLAGCDSFQEEETPEDPLVALQAHVNRFVNEAADRGHSVRSIVEGLEISFQERLVADDGLEYCGYVPVDNETGLYTNTVQFSLHDECWTEVSDAARETLVFHELGHAVLDRVHREDELPNGAAASIMVSQGYARLYSGPDDERRAYYIDELFDASTPVPDWASE